MRTALSSLRLLLTLTVLTGVIYPLLVTLVAGALMPGPAGGALIVHEGRVIGSRLIAQNFEGAVYFWPRPSAVAFNPLPSGGSNLSRTSADLVTTLRARAERLTSAHPDRGAPPEDLVTASASGLDPEISPASARYQTARVAKARGVPEDLVMTLVAQATTPRQFGILGEPRVNVLLLNLELDRVAPASSRAAAP